ncbi:hypothetical protein [Campylobacter magnus]|uniref:Uncharacterized protein n=1 Tax=Campylobacter magnus TaxID=3026462 RepID=A0ABT8T894_9BACT|nr:hypothetical protein [Campylobacter magnus]MDO2409208.1 hypothetical protein [Campylobacter magnus]
MASLLELQNREKLEAMEKRREKRFNIATAVLGFLVGVLPIIIDWIKSW